MKLRIDRGAFIIPNGIQMLTLYQQQIYTYFYANVFIQFSSTTPSFGVKVTLDIKITPVLLS